MTVSSLFALADPAHAFFEMFFRGHARPAPSVRSYADPGAGRDTVRRERRERRHRGTHVVYCVRMCDGRHFPINYRGGGPELCQSLCPASATRTFQGSSIAEAVSDDGRRYSEIPNAFVYRQRLVAGCTCNGRNPFGLARHDIADDPTLRRGDILATRNGFMSYRGDTRRFADFVPLDKKTLPKKIRRRLAETGIRPGPVRAAPVETTGAAPVSRYVEREGQVSR